MMSRSSPSGGDGCPAITVGDSPLIAMGDDSDVIVTSGDCPTTTTRAGGDGDGGGNSDLLPVFPNAQSDSTGIVMTDTDNNSGDSPTDNSGDSPTDNSGDSPTDNSSDSPTDNSGDSPTDNSGDSPPDNSSDSPSDISGDSPTTTTGDSPTDNSGDSPTTTTGDSPTANSSDSPSDNSGASSTDKSGNSPADNSRDSPTDNSGDSPTDSSGNSPPLSARGDTTERKPTPSDCSQVDQSPGPEQSSSPRRGSSRGPQIISYSFGGYKLPSYPFTPSVAGSGSNSDYDASSETYSSSSGGSNESTIGSSVGRHRPSPLVQLSSFFSEDEPTSLQTFLVQYARQHFERGLPGTPMEFLQCLWTYMRQSGVVVTSSFTERRGKPNALLVGLPECTDDLRRSLKMSIGQRITYFPAPCQKFSLVEHPKESGQLHMRANLMAYFEGNCLRNGGQGCTCSKYFLPQSADPTNDEDTMNTIIGVPVTEDELEVCIEYMKNRATRVSLCPEGGPFRMVKKSRAPPERLQQVSAQWSSDRPVDNNLPGERTHYPPPIEDCAPKAQEHSQMDECRKDIGDQKWNAPVRKRAFNIRLVPVEPLKQEYLEFPAKKHSKPKVGADLWKTPAACMAADTAPVEAPVAKKGANASKIPVACAPADKALVDVSVASEVAPCDPSQATSPANIPAPSDASNPPLTTPPVDLNSALGDVAPCRSAHVKPPMDLTTLSKMLNDLHAVPPRPFPHNPPPAALPQNVHVTSTRETTNLPSAREHKPGSS